MGNERTAASPASKPVAASGPGAVRSASVAARLGNEWWALALGAKAPTRELEDTTQALYAQGMAMALALGEAQSIHKSAQRREWLDELANDVLPKFARVENEDTQSAARDALFAQLSRITAGVASAHAGWIAVEAQYQAERDRLVGLRTGDAERAISELDAAYTEIKTRLAQTGDRPEARPDLQPGDSPGERMVKRQWVRSLITREDYVSLQSMLERGTHISTGALVGSRVRVSALIDMLDVVADERRHGANADRTVLGWQQRVWQEVHALDDLIRKYGQDSNDAAPLTAIRRDLLSKLIAAFEAHPREYTVAESVTLMVIGTGKTVFDNFIETAREAVDIGQLYLYVQTGGLYQPQYMSEVAQALEQGASVMDVLKGMVMNLIETPARFLAAVMRQDFLAIGEEIANLYDLAHTIRSMPHLREKLPGLQAQTRRATNILKARTIAMNGPEWQRMVPPKVHTTYDWRSVSRNLRDQQQQLRSDMQAAGHDASGKAGNGPGKPPAPPDSPPPGGGDPPTPPFNGKDLGPISLRVNDTSFMLGIASLEGPTLFIDSLHLQFSGPSGLHGVSKKLLDYIGEHPGVTTLRLRGRITDASFRRYANDAGIFDITIPATRDGLAQITSELDKSRSAAPSTPSVAPARRFGPEYPPERPDGGVLPQMPLAAGRAEDLIDLVIDVALQKMANQYERLDPQHLALDEPLRPGRLTVDGDLLRVTAHIGPAAVALALEKQGVPRNKIFFVDTHDLDPAAISHTVVVYEHAPNDLAPGELWLIDPAYSEVRRSHGRTSGAKTDEAVKFLGDLWRLRRARLTDATARLYLRAAGGKKRVTMADFASARNRWDQNPRPAIFTEPAANLTADKAPVLEGAPISPDMNYDPTRHRDADPDSDRDADTDAADRQHHKHVALLDLEVDFKSGKRSVFHGNAWLEATGKQLLIEDIDIPALGDKELKYIAAALRELLQEFDTIETVILRRKRFERSADPLGDFEMEIRPTQAGVKKFIEFLRNRRKGGRGRGSGGSSSPPPAPASAPGGGGAPPVPSGSSASSPSKALAASGSGPPGGSQPPRRPGPSGKGGDDGGRRSSDEKGIVSGEIEVKDLGAITLRVDERSFALGVAELRGPTLFIDSLYVQFADARVLHGLVRKVLELAQEHEGVRSVRLRGYITDATLQARYGNEARKFDITVPASTAGFSRLRSKLKAGRRDPGPPRPHEKPLYETPEPQPPPRREERLFAALSPEKVLDESIEFARGQMLAKYDTIDPQHKRIDPEDLLDNFEYLSPALAHVTNHVGVGAVASSLEKLGVPRERIYFVDTRQLHPQAPQHQFIVYQHADDSLWLIDPALVELVWLDRPNNPYMQHTPGASAIAKPFLRLGYLPLTRETAQFYLQVATDGRVTEFPSLQDFVKPENSWAGNPLAAWMTAAFTFNWRPRE